jgi:hypothetical protein
LNTLDFGAHAHLSLENKQSKQRKAMKIQVLVSKEDLSEMQLDASALKYVVLKQLVDGVEVNGQRMDLPEFNLDVIVTN